MAFVVGLTGGIGSGKTVVSDYFSEIGVSVIDTDVIARTIVKPGESALTNLVNAFGEEILQENGELDRAALRTIAFSTPENKASLDAITHPAIRVETLKQLSASESPYNVVVIPLLVPNSEFALLVQRTLVVTANHATKVARVMKRNSISKQEVERIMSTQISDTERLNFADDVIVNDGTIVEAQQKAELLHKKYLDLSRPFSIGE